MLEEIEPFGVTLLAAAAVVSVALLSNRISAWVRVPAPAIFLLGAAGVSRVLPSPLSINAVEQIVTVALTSSSSTLVCTLVGGGYATVSPAQRGSVPVAHPGRGGGTIWRGNCRARFWIPRRVPRRHCRR